MADRSGEGWLCEAGEAIGNIGKRVFKRRTRRRDAEDAVERWLKRIPSPIVPQEAAQSTGAEGAGGTAADDDVIDAVFRVIDTEGDEQ